MKFIAHLDGVENVFTCSSVIEDPRAYSHNVRVLTLNSVTKHTSDFIEERGYGYQIDNDPYVNVQKIEMQDAPGSDRNVNIILYDK